MIRIDFAKLRILVVDDSQNMRRLLRTLLMGLGCRDILEAEDGAAGLELFHYHSPDIVICDWVMPIMDGLDLTRAIRTSGQSANPYVPIIVLSGYSERSQVTRARDAGVTEFIVKPISPKSLYLRLVSVIANPRPFVETGDFFGPDRRRTRSGNYPGPERRGNEPASAERMEI
ncbi:response regulator [Terrihabitans soli]|uniref:Response regulator n=1 Tax=Terrihabitans soli TaxID=708113 RepID=A0A6S6QWB0_9HYPH|nr:response regulator [Terrihabitans soli]BCJ91320.1 response regulator [Terrihabitans soli]